MPVVFGYLHLLRAQGDILAFGFALTSLSSFGQTYFLALSVSEVRASFDLSHGGFGGIYSAATMVSAVLLLWVGGLIDRVPAGRYATIAICGLAAACLAYALAPTIAVLAPAMFLLRFFGQGMLSHTAATTMARLDAHVRGRAIGIAQLGFAAGEAVLPALGLTAIAFLGWRTTWGIAAAVAGGAAIGLVLLRRRVLDRRLREAIVIEPRVGGARPDADRGAVLRDWRFWWLLPSVIAPSAIGTGYMFHQRLIAEVKGWPLPLLAVSMTGYAVSAVVATTLAGVLIDRFRAVALLPFYLLALAAGSLILAGFDQPVFGLVFFALIGMSAGFGHTIHAAVWAEIYGTTHLGAIRAMAHAIMIFASALTPGLMGVLVDAGVTIAAIGRASALLVVAISLANLRLVAAVPPR